MKSKEKLSIPKNLPDTGEKRGRGRPKGSRNVRTLGIAAREAKNGITPLEVMLLAMRTELDRTDEKGRKTPNLEKAHFYAKDAAPYMHARLVAETVRVTNDDSQRSEEDIRRELEQINTLEKVTTPKGVVAKKVPDKSQGVVH